MAIGTRYLTFEFEGVRGVIWRNARIRSLVLLLLMRVFMVSRLFDGCVVQASGNLWVLLDTSCKVWEPVQSFTGRCAPSQ